MLYTPKFIRLTFPEVLGYPDRAYNLDELATPVYQCPAGTNPNAIIFSAGNKPWREAAAQMAAGVYEFLCAIDDKHGKHLIINPVQNADGTYSGGPVPTTFPDPNNGGKMEAVGVLVHRGQSPYNSSPHNRGSLCCLTIPPDPVYDLFFSYYKIGDRGKLILVDQTAKNT
jgi:hypothetical protein